MAGRWSRGKGARHVAPAIAGAAMIVGGVAQAATGGTGTPGTGDEWDDPSLLSPVAGGAPAAMIVIASGGEGGEGGEAGHRVAAGDAVAYAAALGELAGRIRAGRDALAAGRTDDSVAHFDAMLASLEGPLAARLAAFDFDVEHVAEEFAHLPDVIRAEGASADALDFAAHAAYEIDEHMIEIDPGLRRTPGFALAVARGVLAVAAQHARSDAPSARQHAHGLVAVAYDGIGAVSSGLRARNSAAHGRLVAALNELLDMTADLAAGTSDISANRLFAQFAAVEFEIAGALK